MRLTVRTSCADCVELGPRSGAVIGCVGTHARGTEVQVLLQVCARWDRRGRSERERERERKREVVRQREEREREREWGRV